MSGLADPLGRPMREWRQRTISALVLAPEALLAVWAGGVAFALLIAVCTVLLAVEWIDMCGHVGRRLRSAMLLAGVPYIGCAGVALLSLRADPVAGLWSTLFLVAVVWGSDIGAFVVGRLVGGPRLAPAISPSKTWSGAVGGLVVACAAAGLVVRSAGGVADGGALAVAAALAIAAQCGDLLESAIKRALRVKDSGGLIPGHGGVLDRLDGMLLAAPVAALFALAVGRDHWLWGALR